MITRKASQTSLLVNVNAGDQRLAIAHERRDQIRLAARAAHRMTCREAHAARIRLDPPPAATLSSPTPQTGPAPHRAARPPGQLPAGISEFRRRCALNGTQATAARDASPSQAAVASGLDDPAHRMPDADLAASSALVRRPCRSAVGRLAASRGQRGAAPAGGGTGPERGDPTARNPDRRPFRTAS